MELFFTSNFNQFKWTNFSLPTIITFKIQILNWLRQRKTGEGGKGERISNNAQRTPLPRKCDFYSPKFVSLIHIEFNWQIPYVEIDPIISCLWIDMDSNIEHVIWHCCYVLPVSVTFMSSIQPTMNYYVVDWHMRYSAVNRKSIETIRNGLIFALIE